MTRAHTETRDPLAEHRLCTVRDGTPLQRADRNFVELLQELRVTRTGVQMRFGLLVADVTAGRAEGVADRAATFLVCVGLWGLLPRPVRRAGLREEADGTGEPLRKNRTGVT
ncbi:DUF6328 family protein [Streptomyces iakyrus]|uniref:DUF6328 family protein n=1 Tax=Streptomyces iakyrus TaxID=68219 RepID=UPI0038243E4D